MCYMTRQLFPSPSQGALICAGGGKEGRLAAAQRAGEPCGRTQLCTPGLGLAAARFPPRLPDPRGTQFLEAEGSQRRPASAPFSILTMSLGRNCWSSPPVAGPKAGCERVSGTQRPVSGCLTREGYRTCIVSRGVRGQRTCGRVCLSLFF